MLKSAVGWFLDTYAGRLILAYANSQAGNYAGALAFNAFLSMFPLIVGLLAIVGLAVHSEEAQRSVLHGALTFFPSDSAQPLARALSGVRHNSGLFGIVGIVGMLVTGSNLFTTMEWVLGRMVGARQRDFLRQRAMALVMTAVFVLAVVASIGTNIALSLAHGTSQLGPLVGLLVWLLFMGVVYRFVPNRTYRLTQMWPGILLAGTLTEGFSLLFPLYTRLSHGFSTYGAALALFFLLATWLFFLSQFILIGAVANRMHGGEPSVGGLICAHEPDDLRTEGTTAADRYGRRQPST